MTHAPETGAENRRRLHFSGAGFWYVCHQIWDRIRLVPETGAG